MDRWLSDDNAHLVVFVLLAIGVLVLLVTVAARRWLREDEPARPVARMTADQVQALVDRDEAGDWMLPLASDDELDEEWAGQLHEMNERRADTGDWCRVCGQSHDSGAGLEAGWFARWEVDQARWMAMARTHMREYGEQLAAGEWADAWWTREPVIL